MRRRRFIRISAGGLAALGVPASGGILAAPLSPSGSAAPGPAPVPLPSLPGRGPSHSAADLRVNGDRLNRAILELGRVGALPGGGVSRVGFSDADRLARARTLEWMADAGLSPRIDAAGNLVGTRAGAEPGLPPLLLGSHIDSVPQGGIYDGPVGSLAALEIARRLEEEGIRTRHPLEVLIFSNEEAGKTGSRALAGEIGSAELALPSGGAATLAEGIASIGGDPDALGTVVRAPGSAAGYLELHVEQGGVLESRGIPIGVVEGIVGIRRWNIQFDGSANHAGTTPMTDRRDALLAGARFVDAVDRIVRSAPGRAVATVGRVEVSPGAPNVIPGRVRLSLEIRDLEMARIDALAGEMAAEGERIAGETGTAFSWAPFYLSRAAAMDPVLQGAVERGAASLGLPSLRMPSGAGHDAQSIAAFAPAGMVFVPSRGGISHAPEEFTSPEEITRGADVLLQALLDLDTR